MSITGLLGKIDCSGDNQYVDTYDDIINWENFVSSNSLKMLIDLRGLITIGDTDANPTFQYDTNDNHDVSVTFTFNQLNDIDTVDVLGMTLPINPLYYEYLADSEGALLKDTVEVDSNNKYHEYLLLFGRWFNMNIYKNGYVVDSIHNINIANITKQVYLNSFSKLGFERILKVFQS